MAIQFLNMPQPRASGPLDFSPLQNALNDYRKSIDRSHEMEQNRLVGNAYRTGGPKAAADLSFEQGNNEQGIGYTQLANKDEDRKSALRDAAIKKSAGLAQMLLEAPEEHRATMWGKIRSIDPDSDNEMRSMGIDPNDYNAGARMIIAQARGYQDPLERQSKEAEIAYKRAMTAKALRPDASEIRAPTVQEFYDDAGRKYKAQYNPTTGGWEKIGGSQSNEGSLTEGQKAVDKKFAEDYLSWKVGGGAADAQKQREQLGGIADQLVGNPEKGIEATPYQTGPIEGLMPDMISALTPSGQARVAMRENVEEVVQRNLRLVLGAQFTEGEGNRLIARAFNPRLGPEENARRVRRLVNQIENAAKAKQEAVEYFETYGTLAGWNGKIPSMSDFDPEKDMAPSGGSQVAPQAAPTQDGGLRGRVRQDIQLSPEQLPQVYEEAREAIRRGADPNVVRQRLIENGVDPAAGGF